MTAFRKTFFGKIWQRIVEFWNQDAEPFLENLIEPIIPELKTLARDDAEKVGKAILESIKASSAAGLRPTDWLDPAFDAAEAALKEIGKDLSSEAINLLVTAYQALAKANAAQEGKLVKDAAVEEAADTVTA